MLTVFFVTKTMSRGRTTAETISHLFQLTEAGDDRIVVRHEVTGELAGTIVHGSRGYITTAFISTDEQGIPVGVFESIEDALRGLYDEL